MRQETLQLTAGGNKESRRELDFYPTPADVTIALMEFLKLDRSLIIWEPACGDGAMVKVFESYGHKVIATDINMCVDFLNHTNSVDAIITNPPFHLSAQFIEKSLLEAKVVGMLLKSQYWHSKSRYNLFLNNPPAYVLPLTWRPNFAPDKGNAPTMEVHWTVWINGDTAARYIPICKPDIKKQLPLFI